MNKILSCTDGSIYSPSIYDHSAWAAKRCDATVHVLHMLDPHRERADQTSDFSGNLEPDMKKDLLEDLVNLEQQKNRIAREKGKRILEIAHTHLVKAGIESVTTEQLHGELVESVSKLEPEYDLVVIGKRGESADFAKLHLGSNLERVIRASVKPVLVTSREFRPIERFVVAYDGGPSVLKAIDYITSSPLLKGLQCHLLRAGKVDDKARWYLEEAATSLRDAGYDVIAQATPGDPEQVISDYVAKEEIDLVVMGAYGHSRIRNLMIGSTTTAMVRTCKVPILMFR